MDEESLKTIAQQLRQPQGQHAIEVGEKMNKGNLQINLHTVKALKLSPGENILEIGMGNGFFVKHILSDNTIKYSGCDFSEIMVKEACKRNERFIKAGRCQFYCASAEKLPFDNESFHKVFSVNTLYFWDNQQIVLSEIWRVLKPNGQIIISIRPKSVMQHYPFVKYGFGMFSRQDLINLVSENNFEVMSAIEQEEPEQEINGVKMKIESLIVCAKKS